MVWPFQLQASITSYEVIPHVQTAAGWETDADQANSLRSRVERTTDLVNMFSRPDHLTDDIMLYSRGFAEQKSLFVIMTLLAI